MTKKTFVKGAVILGAAGIFVKIMGFIFRIPLVNMIDSRAMAYYNPAYYVYVFFVTLATSGSPVAVSRMQDAPEIPYLVWQEPMVLHERLPMLQNLLHGGKILLLIPYAMRSRQDAFRF